MAFRREPNPNRNHPTHCPYCGGTDLFPDEEGDFAWACQECLRVFSVMFHGQNDPVHQPAPALSTEEAWQRSLDKHGHSAKLGNSGETGSDSGSEGDE